MKITQAFLSSMQRMTGISGKSKIKQEKSAKKEVAKNASSVFQDSVQVEGLGKKSASKKPTEVEKPRPKKEDTPAQTTSQPQEDSKKEGLLSNKNGTLAVIEEQTPQQSNQSDGINFAKLFGVETELKTDNPIPKNFNAEEIERHYFTTDVDNAKGKESLSPEGMKLYETIKAKFLDSVPKCPYGSPTLYLTGGLPGSGKGFILGKIMGDKPQYVLVDPDAIKKDIIRDLAQKNPKLKEQMANDKVWGNSVHETSSFMAKMLMDDALGSGKDIVFDSSMASKNVKKYRNYATRARKDGYKVVGIISDVTEKTANERAIKRANKPTIVALDDGSSVKLPGRLTESSYIAECTGNLYNNLNTYLNEGMYDYCTIFDNNSSTNPAKVSRVYVRTLDAQGKPHMVEAKPEDGIK